MLRPRLYAEASVVKTEANAETRNAAIPKGKCLRNDLNGETHSTGEVAHAAVAGEGA